MKNEKYKRKFFEKMERWGVLCNTCWFREGHRCYNKNIGVKRLKTPEHLKGYSDTFAMFDKPNECHYYKNKNKLLVYVFTGKE